MLRTESSLRDALVFRSAFFRKEHTVLFSPKHSTFSRFAASGGRGELRSPLRPPLLPPAFYRFAVRKGKSVSDRQTDRQHTADYFGANSQYAKKGELSPYADKTVI